MCCGEEGNWLETGFFYIFLFLLNSNISAHVGRCWDIYDATVSTLQQKAVNCLILCFKVASCIHCIGRELTNSCLCECWMQLCCVRSADSHGFPHLSHLLCFRSSRLRLKGWTKWVAHARFLLVTLKFNQGFDYHASLTLTSSLSQANTTEQQAVWSAASAE